MAPQEGLSQELLKEFWKNHQNHDVGTRCKPGVLMMSFLSKDDERCYHSPLQQFRKTMILGPVADGKWFLDHSENHGKTTWSSRGFRGSQECQSSQVSHKKKRLSIMLG